MEQLCLNSYGGTVKVEEQKSLISTGFVLNTNVATLSLFCNTNTAASGTVMVEQSCWNSNGETVIVEQ